MAGVGKNRAGNAIVTPIRMGLGAPAHALLDLSKTGIALSKDYYDIALETNNEIHETISEAGKRGKWYHKAANVGIIAPLGSAAKVITGTVQVVVNPIVNGVFNVAKTGWNFLRNEFNSVGSVFSKKPVSDFSFKKLKLTKTWKSRWHPKNLLIGGGVASTAASVVATNPPVDSKASLDAESTQTVSDLTKRLEQQDKTNQELQKTLISLKSDMDGLKKENTGLQTLLQQYANDKSSDIKKEVEKEKLDSDSESSKKKSLKKKQIA